MARRIGRSPFNFLYEALVLVVSSVPPNGVVASTFHPFHIDLEDHMVLVEVATYVHITAVIGTRYEDRYEAFDPQYGGRWIICRAYTHGKVLAVTRFT